MSKYTPEQIEQAVAAWHEAGRRFTEVAVEAQTAVDALPRLTKMLEKRQSPELKSFLAVYREAVLDGRAGEYIARPDAVKGHGQARTRATEEWPLSRFNREAATWRNYTKKLAAVLTAYRRSV